MVIPVMAAVRGGLGGRGSPEPQTDTQDGQSLQKASHCSLLLMFARQSVASGIPLPLCLIECPFNKFMQICALFLTRILSVSCVFQQI
jgi:hypothetical protein